MAKEFTISDMPNKAARVEETGIALVHKGELILPAAGSKAEAGEVFRDSRSEIHYHFPVEIEVRSAPEAPDEEALIEAVLKRFTQGLESSQ